MCKQHFLAIYDISSSLGISNQFVRCIIASATALCINFILIDQTQRVRRTRLYARWTFRTIDTTIALDHHGTGCCADFQIAHMRRVIPIDNVDSTKRTRNDTASATNATIKSHSNSIALVVQRMCWTCGSTGSVATVMAENWRSVLADLDHIEAGNRHIARNEMLDETGRHASFASYAFPWVRYYERVSHMDLLSPIRTSDMDVISPFRWDFSPYEIALSAVLWAYPAFFILCTQRTMTRKNRFVKFIDLNET
jgi:hypothetical protein